MPKDTTNSASRASVVHNPSADPLYGTATKGSGSPPDKVDEGAMDTIAKGAEKLATTDQPLNPTRRS